MGDITQQATIHAGSLATKVAYGASAGGLVVAGLTVTEVVGLSVGVVSIITMVTTAIINARHKVKESKLVELKIKNELRAGGN